jgi:PTS system N-acetylglucosamine-specific IIC component
MTAIRPRLNLGALQPLGRALMLPIAVLPAASLMLRLGQPDLSFIPGLGLAGPLMAAAGDAIFHNLGLLFAIGVAVGLARGGDGAAGLAGVVCFLVATHGAQALIAAPPEALAGMTGKAAKLAADAFKAAALSKLGVPLGILSGLIGGAFYNRFSGIRLPEYLAFFGGRRFVPIVSGFAGLGLALVFGLGWTALDHGVDSLSRAVVAAGPAGLFVYGVLNRLLLVTGLHHILNNVAWFILGDFHGVTGDLNRFMAGDPAAGAFMSGFFPVMMFGLPAACLAMYHAARLERRKAVGGMLLSLALTALLTGVTEPIEFSFMFLAPALYLLHALLTGASMALMDALHVRLGFGFSAGLFDYVLNFNKATRPLLLLPVGAAYFGVYYGLFRWVIARFNLKTPGREDEPAMAAAGQGAKSAGDRAAGFIAALGGAANLQTVDACTTRLRLVVLDQGAVDEARLKALGARGLVRPSPRDLQVVLGPQADQVAGEIRAALGALVGATVPPALASAWEDGVTDDGRAPAVLAALGGAANVSEVSGASSRLRVTLKDAAVVDETALRGLGARAFARPAPGVLHLILGTAAEPLARGLRPLIA